MCDAPVSDSFIKTLNGDEVPLPPALESWNIKPPAHPKPTYLTEKTEPCSFDPVKKVNKRKNDIPPVSIKSGYQCTQCQELSGRDGMICCSTCRNWYHVCCFQPATEISFNLSLVKTVNCKLARISTSTRHQRVLT